MIECLWGKKGCGKEASCHPNLQVTQKGARTSSFCSNGPPSDLPGPLIRYDNLWGKTTTNEDEKVIFLLAKQNTEFYISVHRN